MPDNNEGGRPRNVGATSAILRTALKLAQEGGIQYATIERIAEESGVAKSTIYRRWPNSSSVLMTAFLQDVSPHIEYKQENTIDVEMKRTVKMLVRVLEGGRGELLRNILGFAQSDPELRKAFLNHWIMPRRDEGRRALLRAKELGELHDNCDVELILDIIYGAVYYRLTVSFEPANSEFVDSVVGQAFAGLLRIST